MPEQLAENKETVTKTHWSPLRLLPIAVLIAGLIAFFAFGLDQYISFEVLKSHRHALLNWVEETGTLALILFALGYAVMTAFSIPGGALATIAGGFLFGIVGGTIASVLGATAGAIAVFIAARYALGEYLQARAGPALQRMEEGFRKDALSYLLFLRLIPVFPFWLVNLVPAFLGVRLSTYALGTFAGIIPGTLVFASVGNGLGAIFDRGDQPNLGILFEPQILLPILGLAILALIPVIYKRIKARRAVD